jgi:hypothetical protein
LVKVLTRIVVLRGFSIDGMRVAIKDGVIYVECNGNLYEFSVAEFNRRPRDVMGRIINIGKGAN